MSYLFHDSIGFIHLISACLALVTGTMVLTMEKGTKKHIKVGYIYAVSMVVVVATAFMIYRLFGGWGIFHWAAVVSGLTLLAGMIPVILRKPKNNWLDLHFSFMYWSVLGLYMAFVSEMSTRIPETPFFSMVAIATGCIGIIGGIYFYFAKKEWGNIR